MGIPIWSEFERWVVEHGSAATLKERLALAKDLHDEFARKISQLEAENAQLRQRNSELERKAADALAAEQYTQHRGALFKKLPSGGYDYAVYCPQCRLAMFAFPDGELYNCGQCGIPSSFKEADIERIRKELA